MRHLRAAARVTTMSVLPVIVYPPSPTGGRRVRIDGQILGLAYNVRDIAEFLRRAGLDDIDETDIETSTLIDWRGGGPDVWHAP